MYTNRKPENVVIYDYPEAGQVTVMQFYFPARAAAILSANGLNAVYEPEYVNYLPKMLRRQAL